MLLRVLLYAALLATILLLLASWPQLLGLHRSTLFAQAVALRGWLVVAAGFLALTALAVAWIAPTGKGNWSALAVTLLAIGGLNVAVLASRGLGREATGAPHPDTITVFAWNTLGGAPGAAAIARFALDEGVDVLALPETTRPTVEEIAGLMAAAGRPMQVFIAVGNSTSFTQSTALLVSEALWEYRVDMTVGSTPGVPSLVVRPVGHGGPTLVSVHPVPPTPTRMNEWKDGLAWLAELCRSRNVILAGDFNATLDHFHGLRDAGADLGACRDGALATGNASVGTWPSLVPPLLGSPIDRVMATNEWGFASFRVARELDGLGSDHRAVIATLYSRLLAQTTDAERSL